MAQGGLRNFMPTEPLDQEQISAAQQILGLHFSEPALLALALTHKSFVNENPVAGVESNERMEFLGDSVINFIVGHRLYDEIPNAPEGELTARRAQVVRRETLAIAAQKLGLGSWLVMGKGEASSGGADRTSNLANAFEAVAGAVFLDRGFKAACEFTAHALETEIAAALASTSKDPKSILQELLQGRGLNSPEYALLSAEGPDHDRTFIIEARVDGEAAGRGEGRRKIDAERAAALDAVSRYAALQHADGGSETAK